MIREGTNSMGRQRSVFLSSQERYSPQKLGLRTHRSGLLSPLIFMSAVRRLQNSRTGLKKRHLNKGYVSAEMHGSGPKCCTSSKGIWKKKEQHSSHLRKFGVCLRHWPLNQITEFVVGPPCSCWAGRTRMLQQNWKLDEYPEPYERHVG